MGVFLLQAMYHLYHLRKNLADKYLKVYEMGKVQPETIPERKRLIDKDYEELTKKLEKLVSTRDVTIKTI